MTLVEPSARRLIPVRLCDLPLDVRLSAARQVASRAQDMGDRQDVLYAALRPSETTYYVTFAALPMLRMWKAAA